MSEEFGGDILLQDTLDGGEILIKNGLVMCDEGFRTAVYLSLFGGNDQDSGKVDNDETWWGNRLDGVSENEKMVSRFQNFIKTFPMTSKNITLAEECVKSDLNWMLVDEMADSINVSITTENSNRVNLEVIISKSGEIIESGKFGLQWESMANGI